LKLLKYTKNLQQYFGTTWWSVLVLVKWH